MAPCRNGFTLIELSVVLLLLGIIALIALPRLDRGLLSGGMNSAIQDFSLAIESLRNESATTRTPHRLYMNLDEGRYWPAVRDESEGFSRISVSFLSEKHLPRGISFMDVVSPREGKATEGEVFMNFFPTGVTEEVTVHLKSDDGEISTLVILPLSGRIRVYDRYVEVKR